MYFNFDMPSALWAKRVRTFNVKFSASNNMFCKATANHAHLIVCFIRKLRLSWAIALKQIKLRQFIIYLLYEYF